MYIHILFYIYTYICIHVYVYICMYVYRKCTFALNLPAIPSKCKNMHILYTFTQKLNF